MGILSGLALKAVLGGAGDLISKGFDLVARHPWPSATVVLGSFLAWQLVVTVPHLKDARDREVAAHIKTKKDYREAQAKAAQAFLDQKKRYETEMALIAREADEDVRQAEAIALGAADRFILANRVRCEAGAGVGGDASGTDTTSDHNHTGLLAGGSEEAFMVAVKPDDVRVCTTNTTRLEAARSWALELAATLSR